MKLFGIPKLVGFSIITTYYDERPTKLEEVRCDTPDDDWLPRRGQRLSGVAHPELTASTASKEILEQLFTDSD